MLAPAAIVGAALGLLGRPDEDAAEAPIPAELAVCLQAAERADDGVIVVGNSKSGTDIDRPTLAKAIGVATVEKIGGPGSAAPLWYAALERCVFEEGHRPKLVIVYGTAGAMLRATLDSEFERLLVAPYLGESEPVLEAKVFGGEASSPFWSRVRTRKTTLVLALQHGVRDLVSGLFFAAPKGGGLLADGRAYAEPALEKVLGADATADAVARHRAIPVAEAGADAIAARDTTVAATLVPDLVALARAAGTRIVFVQAPVSPAKAETYDKADPALVRELVATFNAEGAGFVDLTTLDLPASAYGDGIHMNSAGRARVTAALGERLRALDALAADAFPAAPLPRVPAEVRRDGTPPALPTPGEPKRGPWTCGWQIGLPGLAGISDSVLARLGVGQVSPLRLLEDGAPLAPHGTRDEFDLACAGAFNHQNGAIKFSPRGGPADVVPSRTYTVGLSDELPLRDPFGREAWWVYPGTTLRADAAEGWADPVDGFAVRVEAVVAIPGASPATLSWEGGSAPVVAEGIDGEATVAGPAPEGPWSVEVRSPPDGPWLLVRRVVAGTSAAPWYLVGAADAGRTVDLLKGDVAYAGAPPAIGSLGRIFPAKDGGWRIEADALGVPNGEEVARMSGISACSPLTIAEDGVPLPAPNTAPRLVLETPGAWQHTAFGVRFVTVDGSSPLENGRAYTAHLDPARKCRSAWWLYPGDVARFTLPARRLGTFSRGATRLELTAAALGDAGTSALTARVLVGDEEHFAGTAPLAGIDRAPPSWTLARAVLPTSPDLTVELSVPADGPFTLITALALFEPGRPAFPAVGAADATRGAGSAP